VGEPAKQRFVLDPEGGRIAIYLDDTLPTPDSEESDHNDYPTSDIIQSPLPMIVAAGNNNQIPKCTSGDKSSLNAGGTEGGTWGSASYDPQNTYQFEERFPRGIGISISEPVISDYYPQPNTKRSKFENNDEEETDSNSNIYDYYGALDANPPATGPQY